MLFQRLLAVLVLIIPGAISMYGVKLMRDASFEYFGPLQSVQWGLFILGLFLFIIGLAFIGGWIFYRDYKRNLVQKKLARLMQARQSQQEGQKD